MKSKEIEILIKHRLEQAHEVKDFHRAFELRQSIDYKIIKPISPDKSTDIFQKAANFVQAVEQYLTRDINNSK